MAKAAAVTQNSSKMAKKKSQQDLNADTPVKAKTAKQAEDAVAPATAEPSSTKAKKEQKLKHAVKAAETKPQSINTQDEKKRASAAEAAPAKAKKAEKKVDEAGDKKKRKAADVEEKEVQTLEKSDKKRRDAAAADSSEAVTEAPGKASTSEPKTAKKGKAAHSRDEQASQPTQSQKVQKERKKMEELKPTPKVASPSAEERGNDEDAAADDEPEQEFYGFESDDNDSSDDEMPDEIPGIDINKLPTIAKDDETVRRRLEKAKRKPTEDRGVIYLGRIPHGFYEDEMRAYFSQFGNVTRLRLSRNKKTGKSKHYAFIEFDSSSVAQIVAETMDNYLLMGHILTCKVIPKDQVHPELWVGANRKYRPVPRDRIARLAHNKPRTEEEREKAERRLLKRQELRKRKLEEAGIDYDFEAVAYKKKPKPTEA
ncbi:hypothetical protein BD414DRAFT_472377 [Trametes punicea]|nr:hypothetical protein BD414DRAFT_472377 [Trametes punicea]